MRNIIITVTKAEIPAGYKPLKTTSDGKVVAILREYQKLAA